MKRKNYFKTFSVFFMLMLLSIGCQPESGSNTEPTKKTFAITFDANGGSGEMKAQTAESGSEITLTANAFIREGFTFSGWATSAGVGVSYSDKAKITVTGDITLYAKWTKTYTVTFDANGGEGKLPGDISTTAGEEFALPAAELTKTGYDFKGWCATADGTGSTYEAGAKAKDLSTENGATVTLYAKWAVTAANVSEAIANLTEEGTHTVTVAGEISADDLTKVANAISGLAENVKIILDLAGTTGLSEIPEDFMSNKDENLAGIVIPASVTEIKSNFWSCSNLSVLKVAENNPAYKSVGNIIYTKDGQTLVLAARSLTEVTIPANVVTIGIYAFQTCDKLQKVTFEQESLLETIEDYAFSDCNELTEITLPFTLRTLGEEVFNCCFELKSITLPEGIKTIPTCTFLNCKALAEVSLPSTLESIENMAFYNMGLSTVKYNGTKSGWDNIQKGNYNDDLDNAAVICMGSDPKEVYAPADKAAAAIATLESGTKANRNICTVKITSREESDKDFLKEIGEKIESRYAEYVCINLDLSATSITEIPEKAFYGVSLLEITLPDSLDTIRMKAFKDDYKLKKIVIPDNVRIIEAESFNGCLYLAEITLPASLTNIGEYTFDDCVSLKTVKYGGTKAQWAQIKIDDYNDKLTGAKIICTDGDI